MIESDKHEDLENYPIVEMTYSHAAGLVFTGFMMGLLHVAAGPDHLSALATLAVGSSWKALSLGVRWGIGHSTGLIVVAIIFIALKGDLDLRALGRYCDVLVGIFMVILGTHGVLDSISMYHTKRNKKDSKDNSIVIEKSSSSSSSSSLFQSQNNSGHNHSNHSILVRSISEKDLAKSVFTLSNHSIYSSWFNISVDMQDPLTQRMVSFLIGLLHGVAGPGGILGVLPAVEMRSWKSSFIYLSTFVITSTLSMGTFAAIYGEVTKRIGSTAESMELGLRVFSAGMSISVGIIWLVLSALGKLDEYFH